MAEEMALLHLSTLFVLTRRRMEFFLLGEWISKVEAFSSGKLASFVRQVSWSDVHFISELGDVNSGGIMEDEEEEVDGATGTLELTFGLDEETWARKDIGGGSQPKSPNSIALWKYGVTSFM